MRQQLQVLLAALLVLIGGYVGYVTVFGPEDLASLELIEVQGEVSTQDAAGTTHAAAVGDAVHPNDRISVGPQGHALLSVGPESTLRLQARSTIRVLGVEPDSVRVELEGGRVQARVRPGGPRLGVHSRGRGLVVEDGDFDLGIDTGGAMAADVDRGQVTLLGIEGAQELDGGQRLYALPGTTAIVSEVPRELLLRVNWPTDTRVTEEQLQLDGRTEPYAEVQVGHEGQWARVRAGADGRFQASVPLEEGDHPLTVRVNSALGESREDQRTVHREAPHPGNTTAEVLWGP